MHKKNKKLSVFQQFVLSEQWSVKAVLLPVVSNKKHILTLSPIIGQNKLARL
jgi:hypothetical protein